MEVGTDLYSLKDLLPTIKDVLKQWNLFVNEDKTEFAHIHLAKKDDVDRDGNAILGNEEWRTNKLLGSLLDTEKDVNNRIILGNIAFNKFKNVWLKRNIISVKRRIQDVYNAQVLSILLYNCSSWAANKQVLNKLDISHRHHLRYILNVKWPQKITNIRLYELTESRPLSEFVERSRWSMLGHILRMSENSSACCALS